MSIKDYYLSKINEGLLIEDDKMISKYEQLLLEYQRKEFEVKRNIAKKSRKWF